MAATERIGAEQAKNSWVPAAQSSLSKVIKRPRDPRQQDTEAQVRRAWTGSTGYEGGVALNIS